MITEAKGTVDRGHPNMPMSPRFVIFDSTSAATFLLASPVICDAKLDCSVVC